MLQSSHSAQLTVLDDFLQHVFLPAKAASLELLVAHLVFPRTNPCSSPSPVDDKTPVTHRTLHHVYPSIIHQFSQLDARAKMSTDGQLSLVCCDARSRVLSFLVLHSVAEEFLHHYSSQPLLLFSWILVRLRHEMLLRRSPTVNPIQSFQRLDFFAHLRSLPTTVEPLRSLSVCNRCCTSASSSRCMSSSMRALHSSECGFVTLCAPSARVVQASHSDVGPYRATSCFRMYQRLCCGVLTIALGKGIIIAGTGGGLTSGSPPMSIHGTPRHFRTNSLSHCWSAVFR